MDGIEQYIKITRLYYINVNSKIEYFLFGSVGVKSSFHRHHVQEWNDDGSDALVVAVWLCV